MTTPNNPSLELADAGLVMRKVGRKRETTSSLNNEKNDVALTIDTLDEHPLVGFLDDIVGTQTEDSSHNSGDVGIPKCINLQVESDIVQVPKVVDNPRSKYWNRLMVEVVETICGRDVYASEMVRRAIIRGYEDKDYASQFATILLDLLSTDRYFERKKKDYDGWFYRSRSQIRRDTGIIEYRQRKVMNQMKSMGILKSSGFNRVIYANRYQLNYHAILLFLVPICQWEYIKPKFYDSPTIMND